MYVYVDAPPTPGGSTQRVDEGVSPESDALISAKDETIAALREQLQAERQAHAEARSLLMAALEKIPPTLPAPRAAAQTAAEAPEGSVATPGHRRRSGGRRAPPRAKLVAQVVRVLVIGVLGSR